MPTRIRFLSLLALLMALGMVGCGDPEPSTPGVAVDASVAATTTAHAHAAAGETCFICDPAKRDKGRLWCNEHGRYEDRCWLCHAELREEGRAYCEEHGLYEDECFLCDPARGSAPEGHEGHAGHEGHGHGGGDAASTTTAHAHDTQGETCFICDPAKRDKGRLWCNEHGRYEDRCWLCHPELREDGRTYCEEHGLYEDECFLCDPARAPGAKAGDGSGAIDPAEPEADGLFCNEHQVFEHECGICHPELAEELTPGGSLLVRLPSERSAEIAGLGIGRPGHFEADATVPLLGEVRYDGNHHARVAPLADGVVSAIGVDVGRAVDAGEVLAVLHAPAAAEAKAAFVAARHAEVLAAATLSRKQLLEEERIGSRAALDAAQAEYGSASVGLSLARQGLLNLGFRPGDVERIGDAATSELPLRAPFAGTVVRRAAVLGEAVDAGAPLFEVADLSRMWVELSVPEETAPSLEEGTPIVIRVQAAAIEPIAGSITWVAPVVDERTRLVRARGVVPNEGGRLRQGMFVDVDAALASQPDALRVPASAVQQLSDRPFVFVQREPDLFAARRVQLGARLPNDEYVVHSGLGLDDAVVVEGAFSLKSALLASRLGAGCADH